MNNPNYHSQYDYEDIKRRPSKRNEAVQKWEFTDSYDGPQLSIFQPISRRAAPSFYNIRSFSDRRPFDRGSLPDVSPNIVEQIECPPPPPSPSNVSSPALPFTPSTAEPYLLTQISYADFPNDDYDFPLSPSFFDFRDTVNIDAQTSHGGADTATLPIMHNDRANTPQMVHEVVPDVEERRTSTKSCTTDDAETIDGSSDSCEMTWSTDVEVQKEHILDHLMVAVYEMFSSPPSDATGFTSTSSSDASRQTGESSTSKPGKRVQSRRRTLTDRDSEHSENENSHSKKRRNTQDEPETPHLLKSTRKLACPYYKRDARRQHHSGACCGPGWDSVHRIKAHLYRVHAVPLHCRRCYATFKTESLLTEHQRSTESCIVRDAIPMEGFDKDQERALKSRKSMFRAESEEAKWKIVYLILFPDTALGELPSPYYDWQADTDGDQSRRESPKPPELEQFDAFLKRELPRTIRKTLQAALESRIGPIEETLKNELEGIVRDAQEALTRSYLSSTQNSGPSSASVLHSTDGTLHPNDSCANDLMQKSQSTTDSLSQYLVPPEAMSAWIPDVPHPIDDSSTLTDSAYHSLSGTGQDDSPMEDAWLRNFLDEDVFLADLDVEEANSDPPRSKYPGFHDQFSEGKNGKGKSKAYGDI
ncbi:hypothetical protein HBI56_222930 [Parastagonospora nodorum]|nr:hypothetical protein HBI09_057100 [Parastagonospora nodorum]KAH4216172.1 hypothetical protein HBI06_234440 [Parastagonospora nodorum]KAH4226347.1 hypothetical protein HBI05_220620 [Parastagonospora nodorum]KAH4857233.1 hypothetical protein HBH75_071630 [Parastagonospora nodorum]KAH4907460.1 hypothetical protein HBI80_069360 [Parastagonospora nodorum]